MFKTVFTSTAAAAALVAGSAMAHEWDTNDDGYVDRDEYIAGMSSAGMVEEYDLDGDGMLNDEEFGHAVFGMVDSDADDRLDEEDMGAFESMHERSSTAITKGSGISQ